MFSYKNTIYRPGYYQLRNSIQYDGPYTYESGNPYLKPTQNNHFSNLLMWKNLRVSTVYTIYKDKILFAPKLYKDDIILFQPVNINNSANLSFMMSYSLKAGIWNTSLEAGLSKNYLKYDFQHYNDPVYTFRTRNNFSFPHKLQAGIDIVYVTKGHSGLSRTYESFKTDLYIYKLFLRDKLRINLRGSDIFNTSRSKREILVDNIVLYQNNDLNSRGISISVIYNFNAVKSKYKGNPNTEEVNRF